MSAVDKSDAAILRVGDVLLDASRPLAERFRALFTLKNLGGAVAVQCIDKCFVDPSELLKHECAYCLGQMSSAPGAVSVLQRLLMDMSVETIVRHEAGEALAALGDNASQALLQRYLQDSTPEVRETCELGVARLQWLHDDAYAAERTDASVRSNTYTSIDPAPATARVSDDVPALRRTLLDTNASLWQRYRAMFALRNVGCSDSIAALCAALSCPSSALFRHEVAYVLGQIQSEESVPALVERLADASENPIVRHECADALGSVGTAECRDILRKYLSPSEPPLVRESCEVALDMWEYENSQQFQYADTLLKVTSD